ncbi:MAG: AraC family transcriptional regulator [Deinococcota bacterium]
MPSYIVFDQKLADVMGCVQMAGYISSNTGVTTEASQPMRILSSYALVYALSGEAFFEDALGTQEDIYPGNLLLLYPEIGHRYGAKKGKQWSEVFIVFEGPIFALWRQQGILDPRQPVLKLKPVDYWFERIKTVAWSYPNASTEHALKRLCLLQEVLADAVLDHSSKSAAHNNTPWLEEAKRLLEANVGKPADLPSLAKKLGLSYAGFRARFKKESKLPPGQYLQQLRIQEASDLLIKTDLTIKAIAERLHFYDEFHFSKQFKKTLGFSPRAFRRYFRLKLEK